MHEQMASSTNALHTGGIDPKMKPMALESLVRAVNRQVHRASGWPARIEVEVRLLGRYSPYGAQRGRIAESHRQQYFSRKRVTHVTSGIEPTSPIG